MFKIRDALKILSCFTLAIILGGRFVIPYLLEHVYFIPNTVYAPEYSEANFKNVSVGMSRMDVIKAAGTPLRTFDQNGVTVLAYSDMGHYTSNRTRAYLQRWVALDQSGTVCHVWHKLANDNGNVGYPVFDWSDSGTPGFYHSVLGPSACKTPSERPMSRSDFING